MKKNLFIFLLIAIISILAFSTVFASAKFSDVPADHWANKSVERMTAENIIKGYGDGTFQPDNNITRAEFCTILSRLFEPEQLAKLDAYTDMNGNAWYYDDVAKIVKIGAIQGDSATKMRPEANITREEAVVILNRVFELQYSEKALEKTFTDIRTLSSWAEDDVLAFIENGFLNGYEDGSLQPKRPITRAEVVKLLDQAIAEIIDESGEYDLEGEHGIVLVKAENVTLKNTDDIIKVIALNEKVKDSLKAEGINKKDIPVINSEKRETKSSGATSSASKVAVINVNDDGDKYKVTRNAVTIATGKKITVKVNGDTVIENVKVENSDAFVAKLREVVDQLDTEMVFNTLNDTAKYAGYQAQGKEVYTWGIAILGELGLYQEAAAATTYPSDNLIRDIYAVIEQNQKVDQVKDAAFNVLGDSVSYDDGIKVLNNL